MDDMMPFKHFKCLTFIPIYEITRDRLPHRTNPVDLQREAHKMALYSRGERPVYFRNTWLK